MASNSPGVSTANVSQVALGYDQCNDRGIGKARLGTGSVGVARVAGPRISVDCPVLSVQVQWGRRLNHGLAGTPSVRSSGSAWWGPRGCPSGCHRPIGEPFHPHLINESINGLPKSGQYAAEHRRCRGLHTGRIDRAGPNRVQRGCTVKLKGLIVCVCVYACVSRWIAG